MDLVVDHEGNVAPRLGDVEMTLEEAKDYHQFLIGELVRMLCCGLIHGDLSEYNILVDANGPVIIDLPQAVDASGNNNAQMIFTRDVNNLKNFFGRLAPEILHTSYAEEIWHIYEKGELKPDAKLSGNFKAKKKKVNVQEVLSEIEDARTEHEFQLNNNSSD